MASGLLIILYFELPMTECVSKTILSLLLNIRDTICFERFHNKQSHVNRIRDAADEMSCYVIK